MTEDNNFIPVKTNAQLDPTHIYLDEDGYLYLKSYVDDTVYQLKDTEGNPISLKGPVGDKGDKGDKGDQGLPGEQGLKGDSGINGFTPTFDITDNGELVIDYTQTKDKPDFPWTVNIKGPTGDPGKDGQTPYINISGNWAIGDRDTGIKAEGKDGADGKDGINGQDGKDAPLPQIQIVDGSIQYKLSDASDWSTLISNKEIFVEPDVRTSLPENPTDGQIITWEGDHDLNYNFEPGKKYQYLAAGRIIKETKLLGKAPNSESYTIFDLVSTKRIPSFSLESIKKEILTSIDKIVTLSGTYCKVVLTEGKTSLSSLQSIYDDGTPSKEGEIKINSIVGSDAVYSLIDTNPSQTYWTVAEVEEVLSSGKWIQIS